jgi:hypothetical protein
MFINNKMNKHKCIQCGFLQCRCNNWCPSRQLGCCNSENSSKNCAGPVHLTAQWDIGSRKCCIGKKFSTMGGLFNFCSVNGGSESPNSSMVLDPYPILTPSYNPIPPQTSGRCNRIPGYGSCKDSSKGYQFPTLPQSAFGIL